MAVTRAAAAGAAAGCRTARPLLAAAFRPPCWAPRQPSQQRRLCRDHGSGGAVPHAAAAAAADTSDSAEASQQQPHVSVMMDEVLGAFEGLTVRRYVDGTLGAAGHAAAMLRQHPEMEALVGFDLDPTAHRLATARLAAAGAAVVPVAVSPAGQASLGEAPAAPSRPTAFLVRANFGSLHRVLQQLPLGGGTGGTDGTGGADGTGGVDAILLDLGISSMQVGRSRSHCQVLPCGRGCWGGLPLAVVCGVCTAGTVALTPLVLPLTPNTHTPLPPLSPQTLAGGHRRAWLLLPARRPAGYAHGSRGRAQRGSRRQRLERGGAGPRDP